MSVVAEVTPQRHVQSTKDHQSLLGIVRLNLPRSDTPAITNHGYSAGIQTIDKETNSNYHTMISRFKERTGYSIQVNNSSNVRGEPVVYTPEDAIRCFMSCKMETLIIGDCFLRKADQDPSLAMYYKDLVELD